MTFRERLDAFPTQGVLFGLWFTIGAWLTYLLRNVLPWTAFMSWYAIIGTHWVGHLAWRAKRAADHAEEQT